MQNLTHLISRANLRTISWLFSGYRSLICHLDASSLYVIFFNESSGTSENVDRKERIKVEVTN